MLTFFRRIRKSLLSSGQARKPASPIGRYVLYAIGEIALVVIGILIALQINNWNEKRKLKTTEIEMYVNLLGSLRMDSLELIRIIDIQSRSLKNQNEVINSNASDIIGKMSKEEISNMLFDIYNGVYSFFPKYGTYKSIVANNGLDIIRSENIKTNLIDLYDYWCYRYENVDRVMDEKYHNSLFPFLQKELGFFVDSEFQYIPVDVDQFEKEFINLQLECKNVNNQTNNSIRAMKNIQIKVNDLIMDISDQITNYQ